jgi:hypothetical protein
MILPSDTVLRIVDCIARHIGLDLGLPESSVLDSLDEREVTEQLHFGRD